VTVYYVGGDVNDEGVKCGVFDLCRSTVVSQRNAEQVVSVTLVRALCRALML